MKAISLWQPWASLVVLGAKKIETRHWPTRHRGPMLIHAAKRLVKEEMDFYLNQKAFCAGLERLGIVLGSENLKENLDKLPFGALIGTANLVACRNTESFSEMELDTPHYVGPAIYTERTFGNYDQGRFGWVFEDPHMFPMPVPYKGSQGLFDVVDIQEDIG